MITIPIRLRFRCIQLCCLLVQAIVVGALAYFLAAVFALSNKGSDPQGMTLEGWSYLVAAMIVACLLYWVTGRVRDYATRQLKSTSPDSKLRTPNSSLS